jgi:hypothetical protein
MARLRGRVARARNRRHCSLGRLWRSRYRARVIDTDEHFRQVVACVRLNPVSAGIVDDPELGDRLDHLDGAISRPR